MRVLNALVPLLVVFFHHGVWLAHGFVAPTDKTVSRDTLVKPESTLTRKLYEIESRPSAEAMFDRTGWGYGGGGALSRKWDRWYDTNSRNACFERWYDTTGRNSWYGDYRRPRWYDRGVYSGPVFGSGGWDSWDRWYDRNYRNAWFDNSRMGRVHPYSYYDRYGGGRKWWESSYNYPYYSYGGYGSWPYYSSSYSSSWPYYRDSYDYDPYYSGYGSYSRYGYGGYSRWPYSSYYDRYRWEDDPYYSYSGFGRRRGWGLAADFPYTSIGRWPSYYDRDSYYDDPYYSGYGRRPYAYSYY